MGGSFHFLPPIEMVRVRSPDAVSAAKSERTLSPFRVETTAGRATVRPGRIRTKPLIVPTLCSTMRIRSTIRNSPLTHKRRLTFKITHNPDSGETPCFFYRGHPRYTPPHGTFPIGCGRSTTLRGMPTLRGSGKHSARLPSYVCTTCRR